MPTNKQLEAIGEINRNLQIIVCAGSGKTEVLALRVAEILAKGEGSLKPENITAFTFDDRAAAELIDRIALMVTERFPNPTMPAFFHVVLKYEVEANAC